MKHIIWCPVNGWKPEQWCLEVKDPRKYGPCYHCMYTRARVSLDSYNFINEVNENVTMPYRRKTGEEQLASVRIAKQVACLTRYR
jgi:hypothetical protein